MSRPIDVPSFTNRLLPATGALTFVFDRSQYEAALSAKLDKQTA